MLYIMRAINLFLGRKAARDAFHMLRDTWYRRDFARLAGDMANFHKCRTVYTTTLYNHARFKPEFHNEIGLSVLLSQPQYAKDLALIVEMKDFFDMLEEITTTAAEMGAIK